MKVVLISGGASGIGAETGRHFLEQGYRVAVLDKAVRPAFLAEAIFYIQADVAEADCVRAAVEAIIAHFGQLDIVVASAGLYEAHSIMAVTEAEWQRAIQINAWAVLSMVQAAVPHLKQSALPSIVLVASDQVISVKNNSLAYSISKAAVAQMAKSMALDLAPFKIRVNAVAPGTIQTPMTEAFVLSWAAQEFNNNTDAVWAKIAAEYPLGRFGQPADVAGLICFLASKQASFITGACIPVDGGLTL